MDPIISLTSSAVATLTKDARAAAVITAIRAGRWRVKVEFIRAEYARAVAEGRDAKAAVNALKKRLPGILPSGAFDRRCNAGLRAHSGLFCADLDNLGDRLPEFKQKLTTDPHVYSLFDSPTKTGLKVWFCVPADASQHAGSFLAVQAHCRNLYAVEVDVACKDVARLCFVSYDPNAYLNRDAVELAPLAEPSKSACAPPSGLHDQTGQGALPSSAHHLVATGAENGEPRIREALGHIPASISHDEWVHVLMALHQWDPNRGQALGLEWSAQCPEKFREPDFDAAWRSFKPGGGVTLGTLFETARRHGWRSKPAKIKSREAPQQGENEVADLVISKRPDPARPEAFYGVIGEFVRRLEPHTESDPMAVLVQLYVGFGNLVGRTAHFLVEADKHYCNLNAAIVGNSSKARKGTSFGHVIKLLLNADGSWPRFIAGLSTGEGLIACVRDQVTKLDKEGNEEVVEGGVFDKRLLAVESEFGRTLQCSNREGNTLSAVVRQAFDTGDLRVAVKGSPQTATGAHISIIGHITGIELNLLLTKSDTANGFANRILWVAVKRSKLLPEGGNAAAVDVSDILDKLKRAVEFAKTVGCITRDEDATELWRGIYYRLS